MLAQIPEEGIVSPFGTVLKPKNKVSEDDLKDSFVDMEKA